LCSCPSITLCVRNPARIQTVDLICLTSSAQQGSTGVLEEILSHDECDVDPVNRLDKATPLHLAVMIEDSEIRDYVVSSLLEAGADTQCVFSCLVARF
jgi:hypothetical protein